MGIPFTIEEFISVFKHYNVSLWPLQLLLYLFVITPIVFISAKLRGTRQVVFFSLGLLWLWMGAIYHILFFAEINNAAFVFGSLFIIQGMLFIYYGIRKKSLEFQIGFNLRGFTGVIWIVYALIVYPVLAYIFGHVYPNTPTFGVPCPTTIFTFGLLLFTLRRLPWYLLLIPFGWSIIGFSAAINLGFYEDVGLVVAGITSTAILLFQRP